jgi:hypothetical protein
MTLFLIKAVLMSVLPFYRVDFDPAVFPTEFIYVEYRHGQESGRRTIKESDAPYAALKKLFVDEKHGWRYDLISYVPKQTFNAAELKINCLNNLLVVNYRDANKDWVQISKMNLKGTCPAVKFDSQPSNHGQ